MQVSPEGTTLYFDAFEVHAELVTSSTSTWYDFIGSGGAMIGVRVLHSDATVTTRFFHTDKLDAIAVITDESGAVVERDSYDTWGKRFPHRGRRPVRQPQQPEPDHPRLHGQEELTDVGLVHLNGRVYDPLVGRMMSADPISARPDERAGVEPLLLRHQQPARSHRPQRLLLPRNVYVGKAIRPMSR
jgi:RHS repeat-associated protein